MNPEQVPSTQPDPERAPVDRPQIWVGSLSDYNAGILYGDWLDAARDPEDVHADIGVLLANSPTAANEGLPAEEFGIFDYQGFWPATVHQYDPITEVCRLANGIMEHGTAYAAWASIGDQPPEDQTGERFEEAYLGRFGSIVEYVDQFVADMGYDDLLDRAVPAGIRPYVKVDVEAFARDLEYSGDVTVVHDIHDGGVWLFEAAR